MWGVVEAISHVDYIVNHYIVAAGASVVNNYRVKSNQVIAVILTLTLILMFTSVIL